MARRHKLWAKTARARMKLILGNCCASCGSTTSLEFDCLIPCGDRHHRMTAPARVSFYRAQMRAGNVQLLCNECNSLKGDLVLSDWRDALSSMRASELSMSPAQYPARGTGWTPEQKQNWLRSYLSTNCWCCAAHAAS